MSEATFTLEDGRIITLDTSDTDIIEATGNTITLKADSGLVKNNVVLTQRLTADDSASNYVDTHVINVRVARSFPTEPAMLANDLRINGVTIPMASATMTTFPVAHLLPPAPLPGRRPSIRKAH